MAPQTTAQAAPADAPYYLPTSDEVAVFEQCHARNLAVMLKGPTGCGKTRFIEFMAWRLGHPLVTISCHDDLTASDLIGRFLIRHDGTAWQDGPLTRAVREGAICYLDEVVEARQDTVVVLHPLTDYRRILPIDKTGETIHAAEGFQLVVSYNPGYQRMLKDMKPSTRQRFVALDFSFPPPEREAAIVAHEGEVDPTVARGLVGLGQRLRGIVKHLDGISDTDIADLIAFLDWISNVDNQGWPPRPILVTGATLAGSDMAVGQQGTGAGGAASTTPPGARPVAGDENPIALGEKVFRSAAPACTACHSIAPGVNMAGPSLSGLSARTEKLLASSEYKGKAKDLAGYIHESIVEPSAHTVPGPMYSANGVSFMPTTYAKDLTPAQIDQLAAYLSSLK